MDYEAVRQGLEQAIPYNRHLGLEWPRSATAAAWSACPRTSACTTTSARSTPAPVLGRRGGLRRRVRGRVRGADGRDHAARAHRRDLLPEAGARPDHGDRHAGRGKDALLERLDADGKVEFPVEVEMTDADGNTVASMTVNWHVRKNA